MNRIVIVSFLWKEDGGYVHPYKETNPFVVEEGECADFCQKIKEQFGSHSKIYSLEVNSYPLYKKAGEIVLTARTNKPPFEIHPDGSIV